MTKLDFIETLNDKLSGLPEDDILRSLEYYTEIIDDLIEDGMTEEQAVEQLDSVDDIADRILLEVPLTKLVKQKIKPRRALRAWEIVLLILGSPIWLSLAITAFAVVISVYAALWAVVISLYAAALSVAVSAVAGIVLAIAFIVTGGVPSFLIALGTALFCGGLSILMLFAFNQVTRGVIVLGKLILIGIKRCFVRKESVK